MPIRTTHPVTAAEFDIARERGDARTIARYLRQGGSVDRQEFFLWLADLFDPKPTERRILRFGWRGKGAPPSNLALYETTRIGETAEALYRSMLASGQQVKKHLVVEHVAAEFGRSKRTVENAWHHVTDRERRRRAAGK